MCELDSHICHSDEVKNRERLVYKNNLFDFVQLLGTLQE